MAALITLAPTILIVDDHVATAKSLSVLLRSAGYLTEIVHSGAAALAKVAVSKPNAAMIDIHLPDLNGLILSQKLREKMGPDAPLILLSGDTSMETINALPHVGATYFVSKPIHSSSLLELVKHWLPRRGVTSRRVINRSHARKCVGKPWTCVHGYKSATAQIDANFPSTYFCASSV